MGIVEAKKFLVFSERELEKHLKLLEACDAYAETLGDSMPGEGLGQVVNLHQQDGAALLKSSKVMPRVTDEKGGWKLLPCV